MSFHALAVFGGAAYASVRRNQREFWQKDDASRANKPWAPPEVDFFRQFNSAHAEAAAARGAAAMARHFWRLLTCRETALKWPHVTSFLHYVLFARMPPF